MIAGIELVGGGAGGWAVPSFVARAGERASTRFLEFLTAIGALGGKRWWRSSGSPPAMAGMNLAWFEPLVRVPVSAGAMTAVTGVVATTLLTLMAAAFRAERGAVFSGRWLPASVVPLGAIVVLADLEVGKAFDRAKDCGCPTDVTDESCLRR